MAYEIQGVIGKVGAFGLDGSEDITVIQLHHGVELVPIGKVMRGKFGIPFLPLTDEGHALLPASIEKLCRLLSATSKVAYIEAELFGGAGTQAFVLFERGERIAGPVTDPSAINEALKMLGVESNTPETDEFDFVGLGRHRGTDQWLS